jgi:hypothetical protein
MNLLDHFISQKQYYTLMNLINLKTINVIGVGPQPVPPW